jgi:uncharacterized membrane protein YvbJ
MWQCKKCGKSAEDQFESCWNCGTSKEGVEDPHFQRAERLLAKSGTHRRKGGFAYSRLADIALVVSSIAAIGGCAVTLIAIVVAAYNGELVQAFVVLPIAFFLQMGMLVVFERVQDLEPPPPPKAEVEL